jgi:hypothetical protein
MYSPASINFDSSGNMLIQDTLNWRTYFVPKIPGTYYGVSASTSNSVYTVLGGGSTSYFSGNPNGYDASVPIICGTVLDSQGNLFFSTSFEQIAVLSRSNTTIFGQNMQEGKVYVIAGTGIGGFSGDGGIGTSAQINNAYVGAIDSDGDLYFSDYGNRRIRKISRSTGNISTFAGNGTASNTGDGGAVGSATISSFGLTFDSGDNLYFAAGGSVRVIAKSTGYFFGTLVNSGNIDRVAGTGSPGFKGDGNLARDAQLNQAWDVKIDQEGNLFVADPGNYRYRLVSNVNGRLFGQNVRQNKIYTIAGCGITSSSYGDGDLATSAGIDGSVGFLVALNANGDLYIPDYSGNRVRVVPRCPN